MRKQKYIAWGLVILLAALNSASYAGKQDREYKGYVALRGGASTLESDNDSFDAGWLVGVALGAKAKQEAWIGGLEFEILSQGNDVKGENVTILQDSYMLNGFTGLKVGSIVTPYALVGIGGAYMAAVSNSIFYEDTFVFAYQLGLGVEFELSEKVAMDVGYRYYDTDTETKIKAHRFFAGLSYTF